MIIKKLFSSQYQEKNFNLTLWWPSEEQWKDTHIVIYLSNYDHPWFVQKLEIIDTLFLRKAC